MLLLKFAIFSAFCFVGTHQVPFKSPLSEDYYEDSIGYVEESGMISDFKNKIPPCQQKCITYVQGTLSAALSSPTHFERFNDTIYCMQEAADTCVNQEPFDVATSGLYYMCIEQREAFDEVIECIDAQSNDVSTECDELCFTKGKFAAWAVNSGLFDSFLSMSGGEISSLMPKKANPEFLRNFARDGCELMRCQLACIRTKYNSRCANDAGTLLSEALVRPLAESQKQMGFGSVSYALHAILPRQCDFMINSDVLNQFRIDPYLDRTLKTKYAKKTEGLDPNSPMEADEFHEQPQRQPELDMQQFSNLDNAEMKKIKDYSTKLTKPASGEGASPMASPTMFNDALDYGEDSGPQFVNPTHFHSNDDFEMGGMPQFVDPFHKAVGFRADFDSFENFDDHLTDHKIEDVDKSDEIAQFHPNFKQNPDKIGHVNPSVVEDNQKPKPAQNNVDFENEGAIVEKPKTTTEEPLQRWDARKWSSQKAREEFEKIQKQHQQQQVQQQQQQQEKQNPEQQHYQQQQELQKQQQQNQEQQHYQQQQQQELQKQQQQQEQQKQQHEPQQKEEEISQHHQQQQVQPNSPHFEKEQKDNQQAVDQNPSPPKIKEIEKKPEAQQPVISETQKPQENTPKKPSNAFQHNSFEDIHIDGFNRQGSRLNRFNYGFNRNDKSLDMDTENTPEESKPVFIPPTTEKTPKVDADKIYVADSAILDEKNWNVEQNRFEQASLETEDPYQMAEVVEKEENVKHWIPEQFSLVHTTVQNEPKSNAEQDKFFEAKQQEAPNGEEHFYIVDVEKPETDISVNK